LEPRNASPTEPTTPAPESSAAKLPPSEAPAVTAPSFYGAPRQILTPGQGRFARPRYRYSVSMGIGFDDNTQQTPDREDIADQVVRQVIPAEPEVAVFQEVREPTGKQIFLGGAFRPEFRTVQKKVVLRPAQPEQVIETPIPGFEFAERNASIVSKLDGHVDVQWANARELFTMDLRAGAEYYWNRDKDPLEFTGSLGATYVRKLGPRMSFSGNASLSYQSQPDYSQVNVVDTPGSTSYFVGNVKLDLTYRWASHFSTVTSVTGSSIMYQGAQTGGSYYEVGLGNEFRFVQSPHTTWVIETRYSQLKYLESVDGAISTLFLLLGSDWTMSRRLRMTVRLGEALRSFEAGGKASSPYGELGVIYQPSRRDQFSLTGRYGFEQTRTASEESIVSRISAAYTRTFNPRFSGSLSANYVRSAITNALNVENTNTVYDASLVLQYMFTRRFSMNARYSYTLSKTTQGFSDYDRSRFFLTGEYEF
jgi:hypothetical protein